MSQVNTIMNCVDPNVNKGSTAYVGNKRKTVRITSEPQVMTRVENLAEMSDEERFHRWWQPGEYIDSRESARSLCRKMRSLGDSNGCLSDAYNRACSIAASDSDLDSVHSVQVFMANEGLVHWCSRTNDFRGLERWTCREYAVARSKHANEVKHAVLLEQARQFLLKEQDDEVIARVAQEKSRNAWVFAALLGQADAMAAKQEELPTIRSSLSGKGLETSHELYDVPLDPISDEIGEEEATSAPIVISLMTDS